MRNSSPAGLSGSAWISICTRRRTRISNTEEDNFYNSAYVDALEKASTRLGVITNHNKFDFEEFKSLRATARKNKIGLLPGVELSVDDGGTGFTRLSCFPKSCLQRAHRFRGDFLTQTCFDPQAGQMIPSGQRRPAR